MADYSIVTGGGGSIYQASTGKSIPADPLNRDYIAYLAWVAVPNIANAESQSLAGFREEVVAQVNEEAEIELGKFRPENQSGSLTSVDFENIRREAVAADTEGTPWATGYPFLEEQVGIRGADVGIVATYWLAEWATYEDAAKLIEAAREQFLVDIAAAATFAAVRVIQGDIWWPNAPEPDPMVLVLVAPDVTLSGPFADQTLTPDAGLTQLQLGSPSTFVPLFPDPNSAGLAAPDVSVSIA